MGRKLIYLDDAIGAADRADYTGLTVEDVKKVTDEVVKELKQLSFAQPDNQIHLCNSCEYNYPDCPCKPNDVIFGNGKGNDNICACNKYKPSAQPEQRWIPCCKTVDIPDHEIMACDRYGNLMFGHLAYEDEQWLCESESEMMYDPIAWSEKPEPHREER